MPDLFSPASEITIGDMIGCAKRELALRKSAYPRFVLKDRMTPEAATRELALMAAILAHLVAYEAGLVAALPELKRAAGISERPFLQRGDDDDPGA